MHQLIRNGLLFFLLTLVGACGRSDMDRLRLGFQQPPGHVRPGVYWYFMDGNMSKEGMTKDLESMKAAGIGAVIFLEVNVGVPRGNVDFMTEEWVDHFMHMVREAERLDIEITLGIGPGWAGSGGPWISGAQSMQHYDMNPTADMELGGIADVPSCEFWSRDFGFNSAWSCIQAASIAHVGGKQVLAAEAFTAHLDAWKLYPGSMKNQGDWAFATGVNRFFYHTYQQLKYVSAYGYQSKYEKNNNYEKNEQETFYTESWHFRSRNHIGSLRICQLCNTTRA